VTAFLTTRVSTKLLAAVILYQAILVVQPTSLFTMMTLWLNTPARLAEPKQTEAYRIGLIPSCTSNTSRRSSLLRLAAQALLWLTGLSHQVPLRFFLLCTGIKRSAPKPQSLHSKRLVDALMIYFLPSTSSKANALAQSSSVLMERHLMQLLANVCATKTFLLLVQMAPLGTCQPARANHARTFHATA